MMRHHSPIDRSRPDQAVVDCACGFRGEVWCYPVGARNAFLTHVAQSVIDDAEWPGMLEDVDYREDD